MSETVDGPTLRIGGESSGADAALKRVAEGVEHFGHAMHAVEGAVGFEKVTELFTEVTGASARADAAQRKFEGSLVASGKAADPQAFYELAESLEQTTTFSGTATIEAASMLSRFKVGQGDISALIPHIQDLSASIGTDFVGSADAMGRAIATGSEGLRALGLGFTTAEKSAFQMATQEQRVQMLIAKTAQFHGNAAAMAQTASGAQQQYRNAVEKLAETFGHIIDKPMAKYFQSQTATVRELTEWFEKLDKPARDAIAAIGAGALIIGGTAAAMAALAGALGVVGSGIATLAGVFTGVLLPIGAVAVGIVVFKTAWDANFIGMRDSITSWASAIGEAFEKVMSWLKDKLPKALQMASDLAIRVAGLVTPGQSDDETEAIVKSSHEKAAGIFDTGDAKKQWPEMAKHFGTQMKQEVNGIGHDLAAWGSKAGKEMAKFLKDNLGLDIAGLGGAGKREAPSIKGSGGGGSDASLKDLLAGKPIGLTADFGKQAGSSLANSMGGDKAASEFLRTVEKTTGITDDALTQLIVAMQKSGKSGSEIKDGVQQFAADLMSAQDAMTQAVRNQAAQSLAGVGWGDTLTAVLLAAASGGTVNWDVIVNKATPLIAGLQTGLQQVGDQLLGAIGPLGDIAKKAMSGDVAGAVVAGVTDLVMQSKSFQAVVAHLNSIFASLAQALNPLFDGLAPVLSALRMVVGAIAGSVGGLFKAIQPLFAALGVIVHVAAQIITPLINLAFKPLQGILQLLMLPLKAIMPIFKALGEVSAALLPPIMGIMNALSPVNLVLDLLKPVFEAFHKAVTWLGTIILKFVMGIGSIWNGIVNGIAGFIDKLGDALPSWGGGDALHHFAQNIRGADIDLAAMQKTLDQLNSTTDDTEGQFAALAPPVDATAQGMNEMSGDINSPTGFKVDLARFNAALAAGSAPGTDPYFGSSNQDAPAPAPTVGVPSMGSNSWGSSQGQAPNALASMVHIGQLTVQAPNPPAQVISIFQQALRMQQFRLTGSTEGTYPNATPRTSPTPGNA